MSYVLSLNLFYSFKIELRSMQNWQWYSTKKTEAMVCSPAGDFLWHCYWSLARRYISTIFIYNLPGSHPVPKSIDTMKGNNFIRKKKVRSRRCPAETIAYANYADLLAHLANIPTQVEYLLFWTCQSFFSLFIYVFSFLFLFLEN